MLKDTGLEENTLISTASFLPCVSIIEPFHPVMSVKAEIESRLNLALKKVETELLAKYSIDKILPVILKLHNIVNNLNYNTHKKSLAIFVSPLAEKVYYLDIHVQERIVVDESFEIRDLIYSKKQNTEFLVLFLGTEQSKMYLVNREKLTLIKSNFNENTFANRNDEGINDFSDADHAEQILSDKFLREMDEGLSIILRAYDLPVFMIGQENVLNHFKKIAKNTQRFVAFISDDNNNITETQIREVLQPYIQDWKNIQRHKILMELAMATDYEKVAYGINDVSKVATYRDCKLLVVEKDFVYPAHWVDATYKTESILNKPFYIKDAVSEIIEKVLQNGGDAEFVENDILKDYGRIALIRNY